MNLDELLGALAGIPKLDGARCVGKSEVFDLVDDPETTEYALQQCSNCPALAACELWFDSLPESHRPEGVVADRISAPPNKKRKQSAA